MLDRMPIMSILRPPTPKAKRTVASPVGFDSQQSHCSVKPRHVLTDELLQLIIRRMLRGRNTLLLYCLGKL